VPARKHLFSKIDSNILIFCCVFIGISGGLGGDLVGTMRSDLDFSRANMC
jgi:hypothetical protein